VTHSKFPSPANDYIEDRIDLNREFVPSPMSTEQLVVVGDAMRGVASLTVTWCFMTGPSSPAQAAAW